MAAVPAGTLFTPFWNSTYPSREVAVAAFRLDRTEVTNAEYARFLKATGYFVPSTWKNGWFDEKDAARPVTGVSYVDALHYCAWRGLRLPTAEEWHRAAARPREWTIATGAANEAKLYAVGFPLSEVGRHPRSGGPFGVHDIVGNAWEWVSTPSSPIVTHGWGVAVGGGPVRLDECNYFQAASVSKSGIWSGSSFLLDGPLMIFWDEAYGRVQADYRTRMWGAYITSKDFSWTSYGGGNITVGYGGGILPKQFPRVCLLRGRLAVRCETIGFRCASN